MAQLEVIALDTATPQLRAPGGSDTYLMPKDLTVQSTVNATNVEVTNVKAKDGTAAITIADSTGAVTVSSGATINGGAVFNETGADVDFRIESDTDANAFFLDGANGNVGIGGTPSAAAKVHVLGTLPISSGTYGTYINGTVPDGSALGIGVYGRLSTEAASFTLGNLYQFYANQGTIGAGSTVTNQHGFHVTSGLTGATNNYGFYSNIASGSGRYNFFANGSADNYFAGNVGIGTSSPTRRLDVIHDTLYQFRVGTSAANSYDIGRSAIDGYLHFYGNQSTVNGYVFEGIDGTRMTIDASGNVGIGNTVASTINAVNGVGNLVVGSGSGSEGITIYTGTADTGAIAFADGTTTTDTYRGYINYAHATDHMAFWTAAAERMRIDSSGNVGIGGTALGYEKVVVRGTLPSSSNATRVFTADGVCPSATTGNFYSFISQTGAEDASFTLSNYYHFGAVQGTFGASATITNQYGFSVNSYLTGATNNYGFYSNIASGSNRYNFFAAGTAQNYMAGNLGLGGLPDPNHRLNATATGALHAQLSFVDNASYYNLQAWNSATSGDNKWISFLSDVGATLRGSIDYDRTGGLVRYNITSDYRAKTITGPVTNSGELVDALKVYNGKMKDATVERPMLIAHEAQEVAPYAVSGEKDAVDKDGKPIYQQIDVSSLVPLLIAEIQSLRQRVAELEAK